MLSVDLNLSLRGRLLICCTVLLFCVSPVTSAQTDSAAPTISQPLSKDQIDDIVARMSDEEVRQLLLQQLSKTAAAEDKEAEEKAIIEHFQAGLTRAEISIAAAFEGLGEVHRVPSRIWSRISEGSDTSTLVILLKILLFFAIGFVIEQLFRRLKLNVGEHTAPDTMLRFKIRMKLALIRAAVDLIAIIIFIMATVTAWLISDLPTANSNFLFTTLLSATVILRLVGVALRTVLAPKVSWLRLVNLNDNLAQDAYTKLMILTALVAFVLWALREIISHFGMGSATEHSVSLITSAIFIGTVIVLIWQRRPGPSAASDDIAQDYLSQNWHTLAIIGVLFIYIFALGVSFATGARVLNQAIASLIVLGFIPIIDMGLRSWVANLFGAEDDEVETLEVVHTPATLSDDAATADTEAIIDELSTEPPAEETTEKLTLKGESQNYGAPVMTNLRILLFVISLIVFAEIWDIGLFAFTQALLGERTARILLNISITGLLAYALWGIVSTAVARVAGPETEPGLHGGDGGGPGGTRLGTVLPLFKKFLFITLLVMFILIVLSSLGVDIGPLIAGAGIIGIAIGFGAQTLVRDIVSGVFFLLDDAFRVGEYVTIGNTKGTVEKISVRSLRLRHHNGPLHTVPFGEIQTLTNWSRDWAIMKFEIRVPFETDVDMVRRIIKKVGEQMLEDEELGPLFLEPLKSQGVNRMDDSCFIIRCKFTSIPGNQFYMRREAYARIQAAFEEKGIKFAPRRVIVETATPQSAGDAQKIAAAGAAAAAIDDKSAQQDQVKDEPG